MKQSKKNTLYYNFSSVILSKTKTKILLPQLHKNSEKQLINLN